MVERRGPGDSPGANGPGPEGAGFGHHPSPCELIVVAREDAELGRDSGAPLERFLAEERLELEPLFGSEPRGRDLVPELALFFRVRGAGRRPEEAATRLRAMPGVAAAYVKPGALPAGTGPADPFGDAATRGDGGAGPIPDYTDHQGYLAPAPEGVDAFWAWAQAGGRGEGVGVVDVGGAWQLGHEDLGQKLAGTIAGTPVPDLAWRNHGTNVLGVVGGAGGGFGVTGIAPGTLTATASCHGIGTARALQAAADRLAPGDLVLLGLHRPGPRYGYGRRDDQRGCIPLEWWPDDNAAVRYATAKGVLVVAAAGNGGESLDDPLYGTRPDDFPAWWRNPFDPDEPCSGAVLVGAGAPPPGTHGRAHGPDRSRLAFSNHGLRLDAQGWGREVTTTGGSWDRPGDLRGGPEEQTWYTDVFSGTSAAASMVLGTLASLQGMLKATGRAPLTAHRARELLRATGSPQRDAPGRPAALQRIGNRPDLRAAAAHLLPSPVASGAAERLWDELIPYPPANTPRLRLYVAGAWRGLDHPDPAVRQAVHTAFASGRPGGVHVWYAADKVVGLVVTD
ncbi:S8 family serine peptidase [Streptomyces sp. NPDC049577]|uniref:S8 family serine peptidase n=1 Tax=Streptomyces sp. NPDC049577 TaxID=3155153 RepID=UPI00341659D6